MLGRYVQLLCGLTDHPLFDATDGLGRCACYCVGPAMQFTHRPLLWDKQKAVDLRYDNVIKPFMHKRVVLLVRHPLDALVSLWMQRLHRVKHNYSGTLMELIDDPVWGIEKLFRFYALWSQSRYHVREFFLLRYEDMREDAVSVFAELLQFVGIPLQEAQLHQAVMDADFESMKKVELSGNAPTYPSSGYNIFAHGDKNNLEALHVRRGKVGGFRDYLDKDDAKRLQNLVDQRLSDFFGYSGEKQSGFYR